MKKNGGGRLVRKRQCYKKAGKQQSLWWRKIPADKTTKKLPIRQKKSSPTQKTASTIWLPKSTFTIRTSATTTLAACPIPRGSKIRSSISPKGGTETPMATTRSWLMKNESLRKKPTRFGI